MRWPGRLLAIFMFSRRIMHQIVRFSLSEVMVLGIMPAAAAVQGFDRTSQKRYTKASLRPKRPHNARFDTLPGNVSRRLRNRRFRQISLSFRP